MTEISKEEALELVRKELATASQAFEEGNQGMVRVCARRAAGIAIRFWLQQHPRKFWGSDSMNQLRNVELDQSMPQGVRSAARRLTGKISDVFTYKHPSDVIDDSNIIINHFLESP